MKLSKRPLRVYSMLTCLLGLVALTILHILFLVVSPSIYRLVSSGLGTVGPGHKVGVRSASSYIVTFFGNLSSDDESSHSKVFQSSHQEPRNTNSSSFDNSNTEDHPVANFGFDDFEDAEEDDNTDVKSPSPYEDNNDADVLVSLTNVSTSGDHPHSLGLDASKEEDNNVDRSPAGVIATQLHDNKRPKASARRFAEPGTNAKVPGLEVHVLSAVTAVEKRRTGERAGDKGSRHTVFLTTWTDERYRQNKEIKVQFVCCFPDSEAPDAPLTSSQAVVITYALKFPKVNLTYTEYQCHVTTKHGVRRLAFGYKNCTAEVSPFLPIDFVTSTGNDTNGEMPSVAICLPALYGDVPLIELVEWIELHRLVGVTRIHVYYFDVTEGTVNVLRHYERDGLVTFRPFSLARRAGDPPRGFVRPRVYDEQAWMDAWINLNDCRRRLATFTFVLVLDFDELLVPTSPHNTLSEVFKAALAKFPDAAYFVSHSHIHLTDWGRTYNDTDLFFLTHLQMTKSNMLDSQGRGRSSPKSFFSPARMVKAQRLSGQPMKKYKWYQLPSSLAVMHHYRSCKVKKWGDACWQWERETPSRLLDFQSTWELEVTTVKKLLGLA